MEHRYSIRKALVLDIELNHLRLGRVRCRTRDAGMGGLFVDMGSFWLPVNSIVRVAMELPDANVMRQFLIEALVVHNHDGGAGLMFNDVDAAFHEALRHLLFGNSQPLDRVAVSGL